MTQVERVESRDRLNRSTHRRDATLACNVQRAACTVCARALPRSKAQSQVQVAACCACVIYKQRHIWQTHFYFGLVSKNYVKRFKAEHEQFVDSLPSPSPLGNWIRKGETALAASATATAAATTAAAAAAHPLAVCNICCVCFSFRNLCAHFEAFVDFRIVRAQVIPPLPLALSPFPYLIFHTLVM